MSGGVLPTDCCCTSERYLAYPCWPSQSRSFAFVQPNGAAATATFNGTTPNSGNPPANTPAIMLMQGAGGGGRSTAHGGGGALIEAAVTLPATSTVRVGRGGPGGNNTTVTASTVFNGGARGAQPATGLTYGKAYGGGATSWSGGSGFIAAGGGGAGSPEHATIRGAIAHGGDAGLFAGAATSANQEAGQPGSANAGGAGGIVGGAAGSLTATVTPANGGLGVAQISTGGGGGGGGGGKGSGGGGGNYTPTPPGTSSSGGPGGGGSSFNYTADRSHGARNGKAHASTLNTLGDGGIGDATGKDGALQFHWRTCSSCPCPEMPQGLPPALFICLTQEQFNALTSAAGPAPENCTSAVIIGFKYKGWPFYIAANAAPIDPERPCDRVALSGDITEARWVRGSTYCCDVTVATRINADGGCFTPCTDGCPQFIYFCDKYLTDMGIPICRDPSLCYEISYAGCTYYLGGTSSGHCDDWTGKVINQGSFKGTSPLPCDSGKQPAYYDIGCEPFSGGLTCGASATYKIDWTSIFFSQEQGPPYDGTNCIGTPGNFVICGNSGIVLQQTGEVYCIQGGLAYMKGTPLQCWTPGTQGCDSPFGTSWPPFGRQEQGMCNPNLPQCQGMTNPCFCPPQHSGEIQFGQFINGACPEEPLAVGLTITRDCPMPAGHPQETSWASVSSGGTVTVQQCTFVGQGRASFFATAMQGILGDQFTVTGSSFWLGSRCRVCGDDGSSCRGCTSSDYWELLSIDNTTAVFGARTDSCWYMTLSSASMYAHSARSPFTGDCTCCGEPCCALIANFMNDIVVPEPYGSSITPAQWAGGFYLESDFSWCGCLPVSVQGGPLLEIIG